jgi:serine/threonine-protein kinase
MAESWKQWEGTIVDGKFRLERYLGGSEHSVVFLTATESGGKAAIKFVPAVPQSLEFQRAGWGQTSLLSYPHLIRLFGSGQCRLGNLDLVYAVMEYAEENVAQILPGRALSVDETREMLKPVVDTLRYLHEKGLAHGSLKPTNVLAVSDQLKLSVDQARAFGKPGLAQDNSVYAAPEGNRDGVRAASDVWSLGAMLVELLTQRPPEKTAAGQAVVPSTVPDPFREIASHCLVDAPQNRWTLDQVEQKLTGKSAVKPDPPVEKKPSVQSVPLIEKTSPSAKTAYDQSPAEPSSKSSVLPWIIGVLVVLGALYAGSQFLHRSSQESPSAAAPAPAVTTPETEAKPQPSTPSATTENPAVPPAASQAAPPPASTAEANSPGRVLQRVDPNVSASARATITGKIRVRVNVAVDDSGKVSDTRFITPGPSHYFSSHAIEAARRWTFTPPQVKGQPVASKWTLNFTFTRKGVEVSSEQNEP